MDNPTILYQAARLHHREIKDEMTLWRMAKQAKNTKPGVAKRYAMASVIFLKRLVAQPKQEARSTDEHLAMNPPFS